MKLELRATPEDVMRAVETLQEFARERGLPEEARFGLALVLEECGSNIVNHALKRDARRTFQATLEHTSDAFVIELRDRGPAFDPTVSPELASRTDGDGPPGGWGIQLVRRYTDEIDYRRESGENILRLTRRLKPKTGTK